MKIAVVGAGAIGAFVGASLARGGAEVTLVGHGEHLRAMQSRGVRVLNARGDFTAHPAATDDLDAVGPVDAVVLALKAHQIGAIVDRLPSLFDDDTFVVGMQNGLPWWYFQRLGGPYEGWILESVDPGGRIANAIGAARAVGCVVYAASEIASPGVVRHNEGVRFLLGEPDRSRSARLEAFSAALVAGGLEAPVLEDIRSQLWLKLIGNVSFNPISALTRATLVAIANDSDVEPLVREMMAECIAIAIRLGVAVPATIDERIDVARRVGEHKTSMLQDLEARRALELAAVVGCIVELGRRLDVATPATQNVYALTRLLERTQCAAVDSR